MPSIEVSQPGQINVFEFGNIYRKQLEKDVGRKFTKNVSQVTGVETKSGATNWSTHTYSLEEREAFADWINGRLKDDPDCQDFLVSSLSFPVHFRFTFGPDHRLKKAEPHHYGKKQNTEIILSRLEHLMRVFLPLWETVFFCAK